MSDMNTKTNFSNNNNINNALVSVNTSQHKEAISENIWIIGVSKTHPGLKYYFNTVTGVSLWNISREDMDRAKQTMKSHQNQSLYINCPEPEEPPPNKRMSTNKSMNCKKQCLNSGMADTPGFICDVCFDAENSSPNLITVNFRSSSFPTCNSQSDNACSTHSQIQSASTFLDSSMLEKNYCNKGLHHLLESQRPLNRSIAETAVQDSRNECLTNQSNIDEFHNRNTSHFETLDLTHLKMFAKNGVVKDKWYIIADVDVYLQHFTLLKSVVNSDNQCCLMVPQNVKIGLENATKTELRTKAHCANYFIYKMFDLGRTLIDHDSSKRIEDKSNEEHILESCSKLREQNFYVVVISNDIDLQKYRNKIYTPIFTVGELKEYLYKSDNSETANSPEPTFNLSQSTNIKVTQNNPCNKLADIHESIITNPEKWNKKIRNSVICNDMGTQVESFCDVSKTADAEVQTDFHPKLMEKIANANNTDWPNQNDDIHRRMKLSKSNSNLCESSLHNSNSGSRKRLKLRRPKLFNKTAPNLSTKIVDRSENPIHISNTLNILPRNKNILLNKNLEEQSKNSNKNLKPNKTTTSNTLKQKIDENYQIPLKSVQSTILESNTLKQKIDENYQIPFKSVQSTILESNTLKHKIDENYQIPFKSVQSTILESNSCKDNIEIKNVMFEITTDTMDGNLRTRCDEFVSRFVQIMEEALTQVLRKNSSLHLPPPWNMYEATICIEKKFHNDEDVQDASKKVLNVLNRICDKKGNINSNISPSEYMEMYSFGVYMIDALQGIFSKCEDLQSAAESLSKLLNDIQDPETDMTNIESLHQSIEEHLNNDIDNNDNVEVFMIVETPSHSDENNTEYVLNVSETVANKNVLSSNKSEGSKKFDQFKITFTNTEFSNNSNANEGHTSKNSSIRAIKYIECNDESQEDNETFCTKTQNSCNTPETSPSKYNLRSKRRTLSSEKTDTESLSNAATVIRDDTFKSSFFSNLSLQKNESKEDPYNREDNFGKNITTEDITDNVDSFGYPKSNGCSYQFDSRPSGLSQETTISNEPKIVRNFVICSKFENRLKTRRTNDKMDELDFEEEMMEADYLDEDVSLDDSGKNDIDEFPEYHDSVDGYHMEHEIRKSSEYVQVNFKYFVRRIAEEIKELSSEVYTFSQNSCEVLSSLSTSQDKKCIQQRAEQAHLYVNKIRKVLTKILLRDKNGGSDVHALLKHTEFGNISVDEDQLEAYGDFISRCLEHANDLENALVDVLSAIS